MGPFRDSSMRNFCPSSKPARVLVVAALCWSAGLSLALGAEWYESYEKGVKALDSGKFADAVRELEAALAVRPEPGASVKTYGVRFIKYYPYFHLAKAYMGLGQNEKARELLLASEKRGELTKEAALARERNDTLAKLRASPQPAAAAATSRETSPSFSPAERARVEEALSAAEALTASGKPAEAQARLNEIRSSLPASGAPAEAEAWRRRAEQAYEQARVALENQRREQSSRSVEAARAADAPRLISSARLALGTGNLKAAREQLEQARALTPSSPASEDLRSLEREIADAEARQRAAQSSGRLFQEGRQLFEQKKFEEAREKFAAVLEVDPNHKEARAWQTRASDSLAASLSQAEKQKRVESDLQEARALAAQKRIRPAMEKLKAAEALAGPGGPGGKSPEIATLSVEIRASARQKARGAVASQLQGKHDQAIADLEDALAALADRPAAHLYLAVAYYARYLTGGEKEESLAQKARAAMREARALDPRVKSDPRLVSPRIRAALETPGPAR